MIDQTFKNFFFLLRCSIHQKNAADKLKEDPGSLRQMKETDWKELAWIADSTKTTPLLCTAISQCADLVGIDEATVKQLQRRTIGITLREFEKYKSVYALIKEAEKRNLKIVTFKGIVLAELYPQYTQRITGDMDIWVCEENKSDAGKMLEDLGYSRFDKLSKKYVQVYIRQEPSHVVELHTRLWEDYTGKKIDIVKSMDLTEQESLVNAHVCGIEVLTLGVDQHLIYQIFHIVKHFMLENVGLRYLIDIALYVEKYGSQLDVSGFWEKMNRLGYAKFCRHMFAICIEYLGMDSAILAGENVDMGPETKSLLEDILHSGTMYKNKTAGWQIMGAMTPYFTGEKDVKKTRIGRMLDVVFLRPKDLTKEYFYAKRFVILLPVAWVHRTYKYLIGWFLNKKYFYNVNEKLDVAERRLYLMSGLGLVNEKRKDNIE